MNLQFAPIDIVTEQAMLRIDMTWCVVKDQISAALGMSGAPEPTAIAIVAGFILMFNSLLYISMMQVIYTMLFRSMGLSTPQMPSFIEKRFPQAKIAS